MTQSALRRSVLRLLSSSLQRHTPYSSVVQRLSTSRGTALHAARVRLAHCRGGRPRLASRRQSCPSTDGRGVGGWTTIRRDGKQTKQMCSFWGAPPAGHKNTFSWSPPVRLSALLKPVGLRVGVSLVCRNEERKQTRGPKKRKKEEKRQGSRQEKDTATRGMPCHGVRRVLHEKGHYSPEGGLVLSKRGLVLAPSRRLGR